MELENGWKFISFGGDHAKLLTANPEKGIFVKLYLEDGLASAVIKDYREIYRILKETANILYPIARVGNALVYPYIAYTYENKIYVGNTQELDEIASIINDRLLLGTAGSVMKLTEDGRYFFVDFVDDSSGNWARHKDFFSQSQNTTDEIEYL